MKLKFIILITSILILPLIILNNEEAFSFALSQAETPADAGSSGLIRQAVDGTNSGLDQIHVDDAATEFVTIDPQQMAGFPAYGPATLLQEDTGSSIIDILPTYNDGHLVAFYILEEGGTYYLWLNNIQKNGASYLSVEQRFESQDGLLWSNRTDTNLTQSSSSYRFLRGLRQVIKDGATYEGWEQYHYETISGWWASSIRYITSSDGLTWTVVNQPALQTAYLPSVVKEGTTYHMWTHPHVDVRYDPDKLMRYRTSDNGGSNWGHWKTGGTLVDVDGNSLNPYPSRVRRLADSTYQLFYVDNARIHLATSTNGISFTTQVEVLDILEILPIPNIDYPIDFMVVDVDGEDWFYFTYCVTRDVSDLCIDSRIAVSRPLPQLSISKAGPAIVTAGEPITYTLTISNMGSSPAIDLVITDTLPGGANYLDGSGGTLTGNVVTWQIPLLPGGIQQPRCNLPSRPQKRSPTKLMKWPAPAMALLERALW